MDAKNDDLSKTKRTKYTMESLYITPTLKTPEVNFNPSNGFLSIKGKSVPEDAAAFYDELLEWMQHYILVPSEETILTLDLEYFNISSSKRILFLLYKLNDMFENGQTVRIKWMYNEEDEDMFEVGQDYAFMVKVPFDFHSYKPDSVELAS
jgi:hypothetical protein